MALTSLLAEVLRDSAAIDRPLDSLIEYLDHVNRSRYTSEEIERAMAELVAQGLAQPTPQGWKAVKSQATRSSKKKPQA